MSSIAPDTETQRAVAIADAHGDQALARLHDEGLTDGLPVVPPTSARVDAALSGRDPATRLGAVAPLLREATLGDVAVCAVLAGCHPAELDALATATRALAAPELNLIGVATTTGNAAIGLILHGRWIGRLGANAGANTLGPGHRVNATLGRALALVVRLVGGAVPGTIDMATLGQPAKYGCCLAELDPPAPWRPLPARRGIDGDSAVTVFATAGVVEVVDPVSPTGAGLLETLATAVPLPAALSADGTRLGGGEILAVIPPEWTDRLVADGWTQDDVAAFLYERSACPVDRLSPALRASARPRDGADVLYSARSPADVVVLTAGGAGTKATLLPGWPGESYSITLAAPAPP